MIRIFLTRGTEIHADFEVLSFSDTRTSVDRNFKQIVSDSCSLNFQRSVTQIKFVALHVIGLAEELDNSAQANGVHFSC